MILTQVIWGQNKELPVKFSGNTKKIDFGVLIETQTTYFIKLNALAGVMCTHVSKFDLIFRQICKQKIKICSYGQYIRDYFLLFYSLNYKYD